MHHGKLVFAQLMAHLPLSTFRRCVAAHRGDYKVHDFSCLDQFLAMTFAQLTYRESLRDIEINLRAQSKRLYHLGFRCKTISRNTLANANATRPWQIYADFAQHLIGIARPLYASEPLGIDLEATVYALDATTIDLCLSVFSWAPFRRAKAAIKLHTLLDLHGAIPSFIRITDGKTHEVNLLDELPIEAAAFYLMDRGYLDFARLFRIHQAQAFFVTRAKSNTQFIRRYSHPVDRINTAVLSDQTGVLKGYYASLHYPATLRRVIVRDEAGKRISFLTNNFTLKPELISDLYRQRWQVELFFKWIKQHLRIKTFFGTSENAVKTQIWIAICTYVLIAIAKKRLRLNHHSLYEILQILSLTMFETIPINQLLMPTPNSKDDDCEPKQLSPMKNVGTLLMGKLSLLQSTPSGLTRKLKTLSLSTIILRLN